MHVSKHLVLFMSCPNPLDEATATNGLVSPASLTMLHRQPRLAIRVIQTFLHSQSSEMSIQDLPTSTEIDPDHFMDLHKTMRQFFSPNLTEEMGYSSRALVSQEKARLGITKQRSQGIPPVPVVLQQRLCTSTRIADIVHAAHDLDSHDWWSPFFGSIHGPVPLRRSDGIIRVGDGKACDLEPECGDRIVSFRFIVPSVEGLEAASRCQALILHEHIIISLYKQLQLRLLNQYFEVVWSGTSRVVMATKAKRA